MSQHLKVMKRRTDRLFSEKVVLFIVVVMAINVAGAALLEAYYFSNTQYMVGDIRQHVIKKEETLLDVAREYDLGFNEIQDLYPDLDPWLPPYGTTITIPSQWIVPENIKNNILINIAELRLYFLDEKNKRLLTFPVGIGDRKFPTPEGEFQISVKIVGPTWTVPLSLRDKHKVWTVPAGPDNPLGEYWLGLDDSRYGIHGTNFPWSIGRLATQGCIRLYPEDIRQLFDLVEKGTTVKIIYEPVKVTQKAGHVYVEIHKDIYGKIGNIESYALSRLHDKKLVNLIDLDKLDLSLQRQDGIPVEITRTSISTRN